MSEIPLQALSTHILNLARDGDLTQLKQKKSYILQTGDPYGATPAHYAARGGQLVVLRWLYEEFGKECFRARANSGATIAHDAAALGHLPTLEFILNQVDPELLDTQDDTGAIPLHLATRFDHLNVVQWLVEVKGCDPLTPSKKGITPMHIAAGRGAKACIKWFIHMRDDVADCRTVNGATPVYYAAQEGRLDCLKVIVMEAQGNPRQRAYDGMTALHAAAQNGHLHCVIWLVTHGGVSVMERDKEGATPGHYAAARGHVNVLRWLLQNGAVAVKDELGGTPLHDAAEHGQIETVRVLLEAGADLLARDIDGQTAEQVAERAGHFTCVECIRTVLKQHSLPIARKYSQPLDRNKQHRFSIASARNAGRDFYKSISKRKTPNTISSPSLTVLMSKEGYENGVGIIPELKSSKSLPSSARSPKIGRRTFLPLAKPASEEVWLRQGRGTQEDQTSPSPRRRDLPVYNNKTAFSHIPAPFPSPGHSDKKQVHFPITLPPNFKSQEDISLDGIPTTDQYGIAIPEWKRLIMARKAKKELEDSSSGPKLDARIRSKSMSEQSVRSSLEDPQNTSITPQWKRDLIKKRGLKLEKIQEP
ncbi:Espin-like [Oopsacas minuta]|uniref:Espin-like n=1 Tax=Oopsacas minuta TaxID=111878 RepID=A0AAV7K2Q9_9METZ|nr:Espin-like [Oopsacas minuta]